MDAKAPAFDPPAGGNTLSDDDILANLLRRQAIHVDVQKALTSLASALASAANPAVIGAIKQRFHERSEGRTGLEKAAAEILTEREARAQSDKARAKTEATCNAQTEDLKRALVEATDAHKHFQTEAEGAAAATEEEVIKLRQKSCAAAKEAGEWQKKAKSGDSRVESMQAEVGALHEAMAGLHGEMGAVQRELDIAKASQEKLTKDLLHAEAKSRKTEEALSAVLTKTKQTDKRLRKETSERERLSVEIQQITELRNTDKSAFTAEADQLRKNEAKFRESCDKLNNTNRDLNALLQRLSADIEEARAAAETDAMRAEASMATAVKKGEELHRLEEALAAEEARLAGSERERVAVKEALDRAHVEKKARLEEIERQQGELALLEREKRDLIMDVQERVRTLTEATADVERHQELISGEQRKLKAEQSAKLAAQDREKKALDELSEAKRATAMQDERIETLRSELSCLRRTLEQAVEAAKVSDRENAQRLVQLSRANAKLSSEGAGARARLADAEDAAEKRGHELEDLAKGLTKAQEEGKRAAESVQRLEEELEVSEARWQAAQGQLAAADRREKRAAEEASQKLKEALESKDREANSALRDAQATAQRRLLEAEAGKRSTERTYERNLAAVQEDAKKRLAEEGQKRSREVADARRKSKAVVGALQALQGELRDSEAKGSGLERRVSQLSARMTKVGSGGSTGRSGGGSGLDNCSGSVGGGRGGDVTKGTEVAEAELAALRRQMAAATQAKEAAEKGEAEARSRADEEARKKSSLEDSLCRKEREMLAALERLEKTKARLQEAEESAREAEEDLRSLVRQRDSEIEGLTRRNQVLSEALSRLTSDTDVDGLKIVSNLGPTTSGGGVGERRSGLSSLSMASSNEMLGSVPGSGTGLGRHGSPFVPRLGTGADLSASLGDSWRSTVASSFSPLGGARDRGEASMMQLETSLSVLADSSAGFEPPAPPAADDTQNGWHRDNSVHDAAPKERAVDIGRAATDRSNHGEDIVDDSRSCRGFEGQRQEHVRQQNVPRNSHGGGQTVVLHGVSAAMASSALPRQEQTSATRDAKAMMGDEPRRTTGVAGRQPGHQSHTQHNSDVGSAAAIQETQRKELEPIRSSASVEWEFGALDGYKQASSQESIGVGGEEDDVRKLARQQIDQALRERALRRRYSSCSDAASTERHPASSQSRPHTDETSHEPAYPARLRSEMEHVYAATPKKGGLGGGFGGSRLQPGVDVFGGAGEPQFINLGGSQRSRHSGSQSKQEVPDRRASGGRLARSRSALTPNANGYSAATSAKTAAAVRAYGAPQNSR